MVRAFYGEIIKRKENKMLLQKNKKEKINTRINFQSEISFRINILKEEGTETGQRFFFSSDLEVGEKPQRVLISGG